MVFTPHGTINMPPIDIRMDVDPDGTIAYGRDDHGSGSIGNLHDESTPDAVNENTILPSVSTGNLLDESTSNAVNKNSSLPSDVNVSHHRESEQHNSNVSDDNIPFIESTPDISKENSHFQHENSSLDIETYYHSESIENDRAGEPDEDWNSTVKRHDLHLRFRICKKQVFSWPVFHVYLPYLFYLPHMLQ